MKNISAQYQDLLEGRISRANFMRNVRMQFPQYVSPVTSYDDSIKILKGKRILSEAKLPEGVYGHNSNAEAEKSRGIDHLNYYQVYHGVQYELSKMPEITDENYVKARKKVVDKILKDPDAYKELQLANYKAVKDMDKDLEMKEVKKNNLTDKPNEMKVAKKDEKANTQDTLSKKEKKKAKNGKGVQHMTQTPKGKLKAFETPGKEKTLKESITEAKDEEWHRRFVEDLKAALEKKPELKGKAAEAYKLLGKEGIEEFYGTFASPFGINAFLGDLDAIIAHYNKNESKVQALKEHILDEMTAMNPGHEDFHKGMEVYKKGSGQAGQIEEFDGDTATVRWRDGRTEHVQRNVITKKEVQVKEAPSVPQDPYGEDPNLDIKTDLEVPEQGITEDRKAKLKALKEKLVKELGYVTQTNTGAVVDSGTDFNRGKTAAKGLEVSTKKQLKVKNLDTGQETQV